MYRVVICKKEQKKILRPVVEAEDAIYWVNRLVELGYEADVVREDMVRQSDYADAPAAPSVA